MFGLVDCNNFYCSCERVFNPGLKGKPVVVLSNNDGCVISRSEEAKTLNIRMGAPAFMFKDYFQANGVHVLSANFALYGDMSQRVMKILGQYAPRIEVYSIDEAFLDLSDLRYADLLDLAVNVKQAIQISTGIPATIGIAQTKTLAKMASTYAKKERRETGCYWAANQKLTDGLMAGTPVEDIWGIGPQYARFLRRNGFTSAIAFRDAPEEWVRVHMTVAGQRLLNELRGAPAIQWKFASPKKNICCARGFGNLLKTKHEVGQALASFTANVAEKLRKQNSLARSINIFVQTNAFNREDKQYMRSLTAYLPVSTNNTSALIKQAMNLLSIVYIDGYNYHKCGIMALDLVPQDYIQASLFDRVEKPNEKRLMSAVDNLNVTYGKDFVRYAVQGYSNKWHLRQSNLSPKYTTRIDELLEITS